MSIIFHITAAILLLVSVTAHIFVKFRFRPKDSDLDDYYYEFEDQHPSLARYNKWSRITFTAIALAVLMLFLAVVI